MRIRDVLLIAAIAMLAAPALARARDAFAGTWKVTVTPDEEAKKAGEKEFNDTFEFKGGKFHSSACDAHGFKAGDYEEDTRAGLIATFKVTCKSEKDEGTAQWTGTSTGTDITGELTWTKKDGTVLKYTYKGTKS